MRAALHSLRRPHALIIALAVLILLPLAVVITSPFHSSAPQWHHVITEVLPTHALETFQLLLVTVTLALVLGISSAWLVSNLDFPGSKFFRWALVLPLALPTYICAITFAT